ncbi:hypothetical protein LTR39_004493 [Cryomyces antarcticus]|nr:hypothetical protein LTR39_004493 [Cryomyces antarcticus]
MPFVPWYDASPPPSVHYHFSPPRNIGIPSPLQQYESERQRLLQEMEAMRKKISKLDDKIPDLKSTPRRVVYQRDTWTWDSDYRGW